MFMLAKEKKHNVVFFLVRIMKKIMSCRVGQKHEMIVQFSIHNLIPTPYMDSASLKKMWNNDGLEDMFMKTYHFYFSK